MKESFATVEGDEILPEDVEAAEALSGEDGGTTVGGVGDTHEGTDLGPGGLVEAGHGGAGGVVDVVLELGGGGLVGEGGDDLETEW